jgi:hypothetical protein
MLRPHVLAASILFVTCWFSLAADPPPEKEKKPLAFRFGLPSDKDADSARPPFFRLFPGGKDAQGEDATSSLGTLKFGRGESKLYKKEDAEPGFIVVLRRLLLLPQDDGDYKAILEGEFNAVEVPLKKAVVQKLISGARTELVFEADTTKGIRPLGFRVQAKTKLLVALQDGKLLVYGGEGDSTVTHYGLIGDATYESTPIALGPGEGDQPVYIGWSVKPKLKSDGSPETLPIIN